MLCITVFVFQMNFIFLRYSKNGACVRSYVLVSVSVCSTARANIFKCVCTFYQSVQVTTRATVNVSENRAVFMIFLMLLCINFLLFLFLFAFISLCARLFYSLLFLFLL